MNNFGILKEVLEKYSGELITNNKLIIALLIFIGLNLIMTFINIFSQHRLKMKDKKIISFKIKEEKRINVFEYIYQTLDKLSYFDGRNENDVFLNEIQDIDQYISLNKLYLKDQEQNIIYEISDYHKVVFGNFRKKDYSKESKLLKELEKAFKHE